MKELLKSKPYVPSIYPGYEETGGSASAHAMIILKIWQEMQEFLETSAYSIMGNSKETLEKWPVSLMVEANRSAFDDFKDRIMKTEKKYLRAQQITFEQGITEELFWPQSDGSKMANKLFSATKHILSLWTLRDTFLKNLISYIETRNVVENHVEKTQSLVSTLVGSEPDEVPTKI